MKKILQILLVFIFLSFNQADALNVQNILEQSPIITIKTDSAGAFESVMAIAFINAPFDLVWDTILDVGNYKNYMDRVVKVSVISKDEAKGELVASFEIEVPINNTEYTLKNLYNKDEKVINVYQIKGDLAGSNWQWRFESKGNTTIVYYTAQMMNFSYLLQKFEDENKTISMGINISSALETIKLIKQRAEYLFQMK
ncbi:MAG: SRPBCC family protein [Pseudomonadota bacterium]